MRRRPLVLLLAALTVLGVAGCGSTADTVDTVVDSTIGGVGVIPPGTGPAATLTLPDSVGTFPGGEDIPVPERPIGEEVTGNRLLMIGDSIFAGTSRRYGNEACTTLEPLGWQVAVEAESGRFTEFGGRVLDSRLAEGWDVAVVLLGTNYDGDQLGYEADLVDILDQLAPRPTILLTTTRFREMQTEVNEVIARQVLERDNVDALDWSTISEAAGVLSGDGIHPTDSGRQLLVDAIALLIGPAPVQPGDCLSSEFTDDSAVPGAPGGPGGMTTVPNTTSGGTQTTAPLVTQPTVAPTLPPTTDVTLPPTVAPTLPPTTLATLPPTTLATLPPTVAPTVAPTTAAPATTAPPAGP